MTKPTNKKPNVFRNWFKKRNTKVNSILSDYYKYENNIAWNSAYRLILSILMVVWLIYLTYAFSVGVQEVSNWLLLSFISGISIVFAYFPIKYVWANYNQLSYEFEVNKNISSLKWRLNDVRKHSGKKNYRSLQAGITELRNNLLGYLQNSRIVSLPISNFELNRLKQRMDIFFNCASESLVPIDKLFSLEDEIEAAESQDYGEPPDELVQEWEDQDIARQTTGQFTQFDLEAMDEFLDHLWDVLFDREPKRYGILTYKHPINLILLSRFFAAWNLKIANCNNCKQVFAKAKEDIESYYKTVTELEGENRQRKWKLRDDAIIVIVSVSLSTLIQYLISLV